MKPYDIINSSLEYISEVKIHIYIRLINGLVPNRWQAIFWANVDKDGHCSLKIPYDVWYLARH